jgi:hypothetical protein
MVSGLVGPFSSKPLTRTTRNGSTTVHRDLAQMCLKSLELKDWSACSTLHVCQEGKRQDAQPPRTHLGAPNKRVREDSPVVVRRPPPPVVLPEQRGLTGAPPGRRSRTKRVQAGTPFYAPRACSAGGSAANECLHRFHPCLEGPGRTKRSPPLPPRDYVAIFCFGSAHQLVFAVSARSSTSSQDC